MLTLISLVFILMGAINWFFVGAFNINFIACIFGAGSIGARTVYIIIGLMSLWLIYITLLRRDVLNLKNDFNFKDAHSGKRKNRKAIFSKKIKGSKHSGDSK